MKTFKRNLIKQSNKKVLKVQYTRLKKCAKEFLNETTRAWTTDVALLQ